MDDDFKALTKSVQAIEITQAKQTVILEEHVRRTNLLEEVVMGLRGQELSRRGMIKLGAAVGGLVTAGAALLDALHHLGLIHGGH